MSRQRDQEVVVLPSNMRIDVLLKENKKNLLPLWHLCKWALVVFACRQDVTCTAGQKMSEKGVALLSLSRSIGPLCVGELNGKLAYY